MRPSSSPKRTANRAIGASTLKALILNHELRQHFPGSSDAVTATCRQPPHAVGVSPGTGTRTDDVGQMVLAVHPDPASPPASPRRALSV